MTASRCTGVVLAGGVSSRFGGALKGLLPLGDRRVMDRVLDALRTAADDVLVITNDARVSEQLPGVTVHGDVLPDRASLFGLYSALIHARGAALVVAWDMPFVSASLLAELRLLGQHRGVAAVPEGGRGPEPLCAYYPQRCIEVVERQIAAGDLRLGVLLDALPGRVIMRRHEVARFGDPERLFANINTSADLDRAERLLIESPNQGTNYLSHAGDGQ